MKDWFKELSSVNVNEHVESKNNLTYLSWAWAWQELMKRYPLSYSTVHKTPEGMLVWKDPVGCHVETSVTLVWEDVNHVLNEHTVTEYLPCMDFKNKAIPYDKVDSVIINKTIQRSITKCIARLGLGIYIYANEDLPEESNKIQTLQTQIKEVALKKCATEKGKKKVAELCKSYENKANPNLKEDEISGNYMNIQDIELLEELKKKLLAVRVK